MALLAVPGFGILALLMGTGGLSLLLLVGQVALAWQHDRNAHGCAIEWGFTRQDADRQPGRKYVPLFTS